MNLGARFLVSGVDCNDPENNPLLELLVILFFCIIIIALHIFVTKIIFIKTLVCFVQNYLLLLLQIKAIFSAILFGSKTYLQNGLKRKQKINKRNLCL